MLSLLKLSWKLLYSIEDSLSDVVILNNGYNLLENIVAKLVEDEFVNKVGQSFLFVNGFSREVVCHSHVVIIEGSLKDSIDLALTLLAFETLFNNIRGELKLAQSDEVLSYHLKNLVVSLWVIEL